MTRSFLIPELLNEQSNTGCHSWLESNPRYSYNLLRGLTKSGRRRTRKKDSQQMEERRRSIRVNISLSCELLYNDIAFHGQLNDISLGGARMTIDLEHGPEKIPVGAKGQARFNTIWGMIEAEIMVRRVIRESPYEFGFTFERMSDLASSVFRQMVGDLLRDNLVQAHKTQAISKLAASMANEVKGPTGLSVMAASHMTALTRNIQEMFNNQSLQPAQLQAYLEAMIDNANIVLQQSKHVDELAEGFKTISLDQATYDRRVFVLPGYLHYVMLSLRHDIKKAGLRCVIDAPEIIEVEGYPGAFATIVTNLVRNSIQHAFNDREDGNITIGVRNVNDSTFEISVSDNGCGIREEDRDRLFEPFFTSEHHDGGTGLGLNIVGSLVRETFAGKAKIETPQDGGVSFVIELPTATAESRSTPAVIRGQSDWWQKITSKP